MPPLSTLDRRSLLKALAVTPLATALPQAMQAEAAAAGLISTDVCVVERRRLDPEQRAEPMLLRSNICDGKEGLPMQLRLQVVHSDCTPMAGARVDVWHCDAKGSYSPVWELGNNALRGSQISDDAGVVAFETIFPGLAQGQAAQIHYRVWLGDRQILTSHILFDEALAEVIYEDQDAYARADTPLPAASNGSYAEVKLSEPDGYMEAAVVVAAGAEATQHRLLDWLWRRG